MRMKAVAKVRPGPGLDLIETEVPRPGPHQVLIRVTATSICGTDVHIWQWDEWSQRRIKPPLILGHEFAGEIVECGPGVTGLSAGQIVSAEGHLVDRTCAACRAGQFHLCENVRVIGIDRPGSFAEYLCLPAETVWVNPPELPSEIASLQDPLGNAVHAAFAFDLAGKSVLVTGAGAIGLMAVAVACVAGARQIIATDVNPFKLTLARRMGADVVLDPRQNDVVTAVRELTGGDGVDVLLEMSGAAAAINQGFAALRAGGEAALLGLPGRRIEVDWADGLVIKGATVKGIYGRRIWDTWYRMRGLFTTGALDLAPLITHRLPLAEFEHGFELMRSPDEPVAKVVLHP